VVSFVLTDILSSSIVEKLVALKWGDEINKISDYDALTTHKLVKTPQLLTERSKLRPITCRLITLTWHTFQVWKHQQTDGRVHGTNENQATCPRVGTVARAVQVVCDYTSPGI
jgi:hypothetical protein